MQQSELSIIIPLDLNRRSWDIYNRIKMYVNILKNTSFQIIFGCNSEPIFWVSQVKKVLCKHSNFHLTLIKTKASHLSLLRNEALKCVTTPYVLFLDIDIYPNIKNIEQALNDVKQHPQQLSMYPCLYLTKSGSKKINRFTPLNYIEAYYQFKREIILHLAFPSSIIIADIKSIQAISGFDEQYSGHGYEDFDFMLRLFNYKGLIEYTNELLIDEPYLAPLMSNGFRAILINSQLEQLITNNYFVHIYHKKDKQEDYYLKRSSNQEFFLNKFKSKIDIETKKNTQSLYPIQDFFDLVEKKQLNRQKYSALWAEIPGHKLRK